MQLSPHDQEKLVAAAIAALTELANLLKAGTKLLAAATADLERDSRNRMH